LLPTQEVIIKLEVDNRISDFREWSYFDAKFIPISQNFVGEPVRIHFPSDIDKFVATRDFKKELVNLGFNPDQMGLPG